MAAIATSDGAVQVTFPTGWQILDLEKFLDGTWIGHAPLAVRADPDGAERLDMVTGALRGAVAVAGLRLAAIRSRPSIPALDVLTIALPDGPDEEANGPTAEPAATEPPPEEREVGVELALLRDQSGPPAGPTLGLPLTLQLTVYLHAAERGAILTMVSTSSEEHDPLKRELEQIAGSLSIVAISG